MAQPRVAIRLGTEGKDQVVRDFKSVGDAGDAAANRAARSFDRASQDIESAVRRQAAAADKLAALAPQSAVQARINMSVGTGASLDEGSARASAAAFRKLIAEQERMEQKALALRAALDPVWAAQQRVNREMEELTRLNKEGYLSSDLLAEAQQRLQTELQETAAAVQRGAQAQREAAQSRINTLLGVDATPASDNGAGFAALARQEEMLEQKALALRAALDPVWAAQQRFNMEMAEARTLISAGAISLDEYVAKLRMEQAALDAVQTVQVRATATSGAMRAGMQQLGFQAQDFTVQVIGGTDAIRAFAIQAPQAVGALQLMGSNADGAKGKFAAFTSFLGGPWGVALGVAIPLAVMLGEKLIGEADASKEAAKAADAHRKSIESVSAAMRASIQTAEDKARANYVLLESERLIAAQEERSLQVQLIRAKELAQAAKGSSLAAGGPGGAQSIVANQYASEVERLQKSLAASQERLNQLTRDATTAMGNYQRVIIDQVSNERGRVARRYESDINEAVGRGDAEAIAKLSRARDAELKKIDDSTRALERSAQARRDGDTATPNQISKLLLEAFGGTITSTTGGRHVKGSYHYRGQAVDFVPTGGMTAISKDQIRQVLEGAGLTIKELLGPGDKGHNDHFHVAWSGGKGAIDSARITDRFAEEQARAAMKAQVQRNGWANEYDVGGAANNLFEAQANDLADRQRLIRSMNDDISAGTALLNVEWEMRGKSRREIEAAVELKRYEIDLQQQGIDLASAEGQQLVARKASQIGFNQALDQSIDKMTAMQDIGANLADTLLNPATWSSWKNVGLSAINEVTSALWKLAIVNPIQNQLTGGSLPTIGSLFGLLGKKSVPGSAIGHAYTPAGAMLVGENGPEIVNMPHGAKVMTASDTRRAMAGGGAAEVTVRVIKGPMFDVEVTQISGAQIAQAAPVIAAGASSGAQRAVYRRNSRRLA